jgi:integrase
MKKEHDRTSHGEGSVFQRESDGRWVARVPLGSGKRKEEYYDTKREAERAKRRMLNERDTGKLVTQRDQTFEDYLYYWLKAHGVTIRKPTYSMYYGYLESRVIPELGHVLLRKLTLDMFQAVYQGWGQDGLSPNTIRLIHALVKEALDDAVKWRKIAYNPIQYAKLPSTTKAKNVYALEDDEVKRLLTYAQQMKIYPLFRMALLLGMRLGELSALRWSDIDLEKATLEIRRTVSYVKNQETGHYEFVVGLPKTAAGERLIYLPADLIALLRIHCEKQQEMKAVAARWAGLDLVFCTRFGTYIIPSQIRVSFDKLLQQAGLEHMKFHGLRHNASLILRRMGIDAVVRK